MFLVASGIDPRCCGSTSGVASDATFWREGSRDTIDLTGASKQIPKNGPLLLRQPLQKAGVFGADLLVNGCLRHSILGICRWRHHAGSSLEHKHSYPHIALISREVCLA